MPDHECIRDEPWPILCRVIRQEGTCAGGHQVGDTIHFTATGVDGKICLSALYSMLPKVYAMRYNARFPWLSNQCAATHACPDANNPVIFELIRGKETKND
ncbi:MAG: TIGR04076 family protein [Candidatus Heimdallarchaeota archaeon]